ncbi:preprotein translocase subunit YajC [Cellulomonas marina]|uniref:Preprotein translocase subunit YajC n=1 Tax=Cellulomonas marina TaxID=988821 RepID=A0A1I0W6G4_9CELL|nr:preprotein translocase subunit YajC [Cellulomonas marina]GIG30503.1 hypothetical protein Cma02nite_31030 [Cellulomonas marina]SFA84151.1 preprotein translocase subunit YajC [Cellulomonas marina]
MELILLAVLMGGVLWFMSRGTRKQQKEAANFRSNLAPGDEVMTGSGFFGTVVAVEDDVITLESTPGQESRWLRAAIAKRVDPPVATDDADEYEDEYDDDEYDDAYDDADATDPVLDGPTGDRRTGGATAATPPPPPGTVGGTVGGTLGGTAGTTPTGGDDTRR